MPAIAGLEARRYFQFLDRSILLAVLVSGVLLASAWPLVREHGVRPGAGLYVVESLEDAAFLPVAQSDSAFRVEVGLHGLFFSGKADLLLVATKINYNPSSEKSRAAAQELERATRLWLDDRLGREADRAAAFPVNVNVVYASRNGVHVPTPVPSASATPTPGPTGATAAVTTDPSATTLEPQLLTQPGDHQVALRPNQVDPPFPIHSLVLTFAYLIPLNFIGQLYAGSFFQERTRQRGLLLLSAPVTGPQIVLAKSVPYLAFTLLLAAATTVAIGATFVGFLAALPILAFGFASTLLIGLLARSLRELTFLLVVTTVLLSTFLFLPAIFVQIPAVAFLSPVSVIAATIRGDPVGLVAFLYATLPLALTAAVQARIALALYNEERLFAPQGLLSKLVDAVGDLVRTPGRLLAAGALAVPFALGLELFVLIFAITLDLRVAFVVFLLGGAFVEETLKALPVYSRYARGPAGARPWVIGSLVGVGFFLGEKVALGFTLLGLQDLPRGLDALAVFGVASSPLLLLAPLALHAGTTTIIAFGARRGKVPMLLSVFASGLVHASYNTALLIFAFRRNLA